MRTPRALASLALGLTLVACTEAAAPPGATEPTGQPDAIILDLRSAEEEPMGVLSYGDEDQAGKLGTRCWAMLCVDFTGPPTPKIYTPVPGDGEIELTGDGNIESISVGTPPEEKFGSPGGERELRVRDGRVRLDLEPGRYVLVIFATWEGKGDAVLTFGLDVA